MTRGRDKRKDKKNNEHWQRRVPGVSVGRKDVLLSNIGKQCNVVVNRIYITLSCKKSDQSLCAFSVYCHSSIARMCKQV